MWKPTRKTLEKIAQNVRHCAKNTIDSEWQLYDLILRKHVFNCSSEQNEWTLK